MPLSISSWTYFHSLFLSFLLYILVPSNICNPSFPSTIKCLYQRQPRPKQTSNQQYEKEALFPVFHCLDTEITETSLSLFNTRKIFSDKHVISVYQLSFKKKVKESRNRPGVAQRVPGSLGSQISWHSAREGGEVSLTHRPPLPKGMFLVFIFTRGWVDLRAMVRSKGNTSLKNPVTSPGIDPGTVRLVAQCLNHYATPGPISTSYTSQTTKFHIYNGTKIGTQFLKPAVEFMAWPQCLKEK